MTEEYDSPIWDKPQPWLCHSVNPGLSIALKNYNYDDFIKIMSAELMIRGQVDVENISIVCEGQCPKGCAKKFHLHLGKSITKKSFEKLYKHGKKYPEHCMVTKYIGIIKK